jgi:hypothetical protein
VNVSGDDWDRVCYEATASQTDPVPVCGTTTKTTGTNPDGTTGAKQVAWSADCLGQVTGAGDLYGCNDPNATIFTNGTKDIDDINAWAWKDDAGGLPDKDNLEHAFAARYSITKTGPSTGTCPSGTAPTCEVLYFGSDRFDNSGDAQQGFWFLQNSIKIDTSIKVGGGNGFSGVHQTGDLLITSDFTNGGTTSTITIYTWDSSCTGNDLNGKNPPPLPACAVKNLLEQRTSSTAKCGFESGDPFCGTVNVGNTPTTWGDFEDKDHNTDHYIDNELYEAGVNLSLLGLSQECLSTVVAETRSSQSVDATLKDFLLLPLGSCAPSMSTQASTSYRYGNNHSDRIDDRT